MLILECPNCKLLVIIEQLNCKIFRHGVYKDSWQNINPHMSKEDCDKLVNLNLIYGCGKPFRIEENMAYICDYL